MKKILYTLAKKYFFAKKLRLIYVGMCLLIFSMAHGQKISGVVTDSRTKEALIGVNVILKGTNSGVITDIKGRFNIELKNSSNELLLTYLGYLPLSVIVNGNDSVFIALEEDLLQLDEVVVVGYGTVKKSNLTGAISSISSKDFGDRQVTSIAGLLQGKASGLDITNDRIRIRGVSTLGNSDPLIVIDGFPGGNLSAINPNDIERIEVLKDAASTAIYGARGANGVILVTTKEGKSGELKTNINSYIGLSMLPKKIDVLDANQYIDYALQALKNGNQTIPSKLTSQDVRKNVTDWQDEVFRIGKTAETNIDFSGGNEKATYFFSLGYRYDEKITLDADNSKLNIRAKNTYNIAKWLKVGQNIALSYNTENGSEPETASDLLNMLPYMPVTDTAASWGYSNVNENDFSSVRNPVTSIKMFEINNKEFNYQANSFIEIKPVSSLVYRIQAGVDGAFSNNYWWRSYHKNDGNNLFPNRINETNNIRYAPLIEQYITYSKDTKLHSFSLMAGNSYKNNVFTKSYGVFGEWADSTDAPVRTPLKANSNGLTGYNLEYNAYLSYFGRVNYQFNNKYLATINFRADGSPRIAPKYRWALLPSLSLAWKIHEEEFIKNMELFDQFKLRIGWGRTGNDATQRNLEYVSKVWNQGVYYPFGINSTRAEGASVKYYNSPNLQWEITTGTSVGFDVAILKNALSASIDYFYKNAENILFEVPLPASLGYGGNSAESPTVNATSAINKGIEIQLGYRSEIGSLAYAVNANYTYVNNEVTSLGMGQPYLDKNGVSRTEQNYPIGYFYGHIADGVFKTKAELDAYNEKAKALGHSYFQNSTTSAGDVRFKDIDGNGIINDKDRTYLGDPIPDHYFGLNINLNYKRFDFSMFWQGIYGASIFNMHYAQNRGGVQMRNQETYVVDRWQSEQNPGNGIVPRAVLGDPANNNRPSSLMVSPANYAKLRQASFGYVIPKLITQTIKVDQIRFYVSANNILTFTKYKGYDPEVNGDQKNETASNKNRGTEYYRMPFARSVVFGLQLNF